jgi:hypothetical membrane protein
MYNFKLLILLLNGTVDMLNSLVLQKFGAVCGFIFPLIAFGCIGVAIVSYPEFSWVNNALSDLGIVSGITALAFNFGLFTAGLIGFFFATTGLFNYFKKTHVGKIGAVVFAVATIWLMAIGIFNESFIPLHFIVSVLFFVTLPVALWILSAALYLKHEIKLAIFIFTASFIAALPWILYIILYYVPNVAILETLSALTGLIWVITICYQIIKDAKTSEKFTN